MYTLADYMECAATIRNMQLHDKPVPQQYQEVIEQFLPTEDKFPERRIIPLYEYPDSNPTLLLENKRGFRVQFVLVFLTKEITAAFFAELFENGPLKYQVARYFTEVSENVIFIKTRGQRLRNLLQKLEKGRLQNLPMCCFHYNMKEKQLVKYLEEGNWALRLIWGPQIQVPLYGADEHQDKEAKLEAKLEMKQEIRHLKSEVRQSQYNLSPTPVKRQFVSKPLSYFVELGRQHSQVLSQQQK